MITYKKLTKVLLSRSISQEGPSYSAIVGLLRDSLYKILDLFKLQSKDRALLSDVEELLMAAHYQFMFLNSRSLGLKDIAAKCAITTMKYPFVIPQDKAFYQAGEIAKEIGNSNLAFMLLNR